MGFVKKTDPYKVVGHHQILADVYQNQRDEVRPALIWIHGGALIFGTREWLPADQAELFVKAGYTVISIDYRLAPETKLPEIIEDLKDACAWVRSSGPEVFKIDPDRIAVVGRSGGGYLTLVAGHRVTPKPRALVSFYGYGDITGEWYSRPDPFYNQMPAISREHALASVGDSLISNAPVVFTEGGRIQFYYYCRQQGLWPEEVSGHDPDQERAWFTGYEPLRNITSSYPPTMLLHGEKDTDVPVEQSVLMVEALERQGVAHEFITHPDWEHGFDGSGMDDPTVVEAFERVLNFLEKHLA